MWNLPKKQLAYLSFYYGGILFWIACIMFDLVMDTVTGFTFGYFFALFYFVSRTRTVVQELEYYNDNHPES